MGYTWTNTAATTVAVTNRLVTTTNMKVGAYTLANTTAVWSGGFTVTATITAVAGNDTAGTLVVVGKDLAGVAATETITVRAGVGGSGAPVPDAHRPFPVRGGAGRGLRTDAHLRHPGCPAGAHDRRGQDRRHRRAR